MFLSLAALQLTKMKYLYHIIKFLIGGIFIFSALSKLFPLSQFELTLVYESIAGWQFAPWLSRLIIGIELFLGLALFLNFLLKQLIIPSTITLLSIFNIYLLYSLYKNGIKSDCGCFGNMMPLNTIESLIKNFILIGLLIFLHKKTVKNVWKTRWLILSLFFSSLVSIFILFPIDSYSIHPIEFKTQTLAWFNGITNFEKDKTADLKKGKKIVCFFSLRCEHCNEFAFKLGILQKEKKLNNIYILFYGDPAEVYNFFKSTKLNAAYKVLQADVFFAMVGPTIPKVFLLQDGYIIKEWTNRIFDAEKYQNELD